MGVYKERIKIFGNSGISTSACDKMIKRKILSLPGDLELPVSLLVETFHVCELQAVETEPELARMFMEQYAEEAAQFSMQAGEILQHDTSLVLKEDRFCLTSVLECHEMIAETVEAKWNEEDFQHDGKNG